MMKGNHKIFEWMIVIIVAIILIVISSKVSDALDINRRAARYLILTIVGLFCWIIDTIQKKG